MKPFFSIFLFFSSICFAQVDLSEQEKIQQQRDKVKQEDALRDSALKPNEKTNAPQVAPTGIDPDATFEVDHSALGYSLIAVNDNPLSGFKFSGAFTAGFYQEQKFDKRYLLVGGVELPIEIELPINNVVPFGGVGFQFGTDSTLYGDIGLDLRFVRWFKVQIGLHYPLGKDIYGLFGAALTW